MLKFFPTLQLIFWLGLWCVFLTWKKLFLLHLNLKCFLIWPLSFWSCLERHFSLWQILKSNPKVKSFSCIFFWKVRMSLYLDKHCFNSKIFNLLYYYILVVIPHSSTLAWKIPWTEEPGGLQSMGLLGVGHDWATSLSLFTFMHWRRKWQPTPVFLPGESQGQGSLVGFRLWGCTELDTTEAT